MQDYTFTMNNASNGFIPCSPLYYFMHVTLWIQNANKIKKKKKKTLLHENVLVVKLENHTNIFNQLCIGI